MWKSNYTLPNTTMSSLENDQIEKAATKITRAINRMGKKLKSKEQSIWYQKRKICVDIMDWDRRNYGIWKKGKCGGVDKDTANEIMKYGMRLPHYYGFDKAAVWYHKNRCKLPKWWREWYIKERANDKRYKRWRNRKQEELNDKENFAFQHGDGWGADYASPIWTPEFASTHYESINKIKSELARDPNISDTFY